jgi:cell division protease FtsH
MELRRFSRLALLLIAVAALVLLFVLNHANSRNTYQQVASSKVVSLIKQGQVKSALITDKSQTIQITTKDGKQLEASWVSSQGSQLRSLLQAQFDKGNLPGGYNVTTPQSHALLDVLTLVFTFLVIGLLLIWGIDHARRFRGNAQACLL